MGNTNTDIAAPTKLTRETGVAVSAVDFSETTADDTETLTITCPDLPGSKLVVIINEVSGDAGSMVITCAAGDYWAGVALSSVTIAQGTSKAIVFEPAMHQDQADGTIIVTITPASGKKVWTDHDATYQVFMLPR